MATKIHNVTELQAISSNLNGDYALGNDIDASATVGWNGGAGFIPIGTYASPFIGSLDGKGHTIDSLFISRNLQSIGLFGVVIGGTIQNVKLTNVNITGLTGATYFVGALAGYVETAIITSSSSTGTVILQRNNAYAGGLIGYLSSGTISKCFSACTVIANNTTNAQVGGFAGEIYDASVDQCYAIGNVSQTVSPNYLGGFTSYIGWGGGSSIITNCYARGAVSGAGWYVGGFCYYLANGTIDNCYSTGAVTATDGGFIETNAATVTNCFWDTQTSGASTSAGGTGKTTSQMKNRSTFTNAGWDFITIWGINGITNNGYPFHWVMPPEPPPDAPRRTVSVEDKITLETIRNVEMAAMGRFRVGEDGKAIYRSRYARNP